MDDSDMTFDGLSDFIGALERAGELKRVSAPVDTNLEIAEILRRAMYERKQALLFENVKGYDVPVAGNLFGSEKRMRIALEINGDDSGYYSGFEDLGKRMTELLSMDMPATLMDKIRSLPKLAELTGFAPKIVSKGAVSEVVETGNPSLSFIPALKSWPKDAGKFITFGFAITKNPETRQRNMGVYRMQIVDEKTTLMHWQIHKRGSLHHKMNQQRGVRTEVAVVIGADPATVYSAVAPVPEGLDKMLFSGIMRKKGLELVKCQTIDLEVPANSEIVLEGYVDPKETKPEGPFGDHFGYYIPVDEYPVFHLTGVMRRAKPIYLTTVVGKPVLEDAYLGKVIERAFLPLIQVLQPEVVDIDFPSAGCFQGMAIVSIKKMYPGQARKVMLGLWSLGQLMLTKMIIVLDEDVNIHDMDQVMWAVTTRTDPAKDLLIIDRLPADSLDASSSLLNLGSKVGIDATTKSKEEGYDLDSQEVVTPDAETVSLVTKRWKEYGL
jgi:4-hydroxy-3-polyprenylbenzoate decarboxylase